jgi:hypothetical protein
MRTTLCKCGKPNLGYHRYCRSCFHESHKRWREKPPGPKKIKTNRTAAETAKAWRLAHPGWQKRWKSSPAQVPKMKTRNRTQYLIKRGIILKLACEVCGDPKSETHHPDYCNEFRVEWLCRRCHRDLHVRQRINQEYDLKPL